MIPLLEIAVSVPGVWLTWWLMHTPPVRTLMANVPPSGGEPDYIYLADDWTGY